MSINHRLKQDLNLNKIKGAKNEKSISKTEE